jgi:hypothetical protein
LLIKPHSAVINQAKQQRGREDLAQACNVKLRLSAHRGWLDVTVAPRRGDAHRRSPHAPSENAARRPGFLDKRCE